MTQSHTPSRSLSEIGHLFLTDLRQKQGGPRPVRTPPPSNSHPAPQLSHEEFERACQIDDAPPVSDKPATSVTALLSSHLADREIHWIQSYAKQAALADGRVGLIEIDALELKVSCFDRSKDYDAQAVHDTGAESSVEPLDERRMAQAMEELAWDVDRWLLFVHAPRAAQGRNLLRLVDQWSLLATADHEGVVAAYRTIKGLFSADRPDLSLVVLNAPDGSQAAAIHQKLSGVCQKFLDCPVRSETPLREVADAHQTVVLHCRGNGEPDPAAHWKVIADFLAAMKHSTHRIPDAGAPQMAPPAADHATTPPTPVASPSPIASPVPAPAKIESPTPAREQIAADEQPGLIAAGVESLSDSSDDAPRQTATTAPRPTIPMTGPRPADPMHHADSDVLDLPDGQSPEMSILAAVLGSAGQFIRCPIAPPDCPASLLAVSREKRLTLLAVAGPGLSDLRRIAAAFQWLRQNRDLIVMALPQFSISEDAPVLRLLVDQSDLSAGQLHPFLAGGGVTVQPYRKLRWGRKTGLLLEAA